MRATPLGPILNYSTTIVPSTFPPSQRPITLFPIANVTHKNKEHAYPIIANGLAAIADRHPDDRILVHTVSFDLTDYLHKNLAPPTRTRCVSYRSAQQRQRAIDTYIYTPRSILLAASLERGIDLPGDDCRAIIVVKVPYPYLGDKQVNARLHSRGGQLWYSVQTARALVQMTGRGMRHVDDQCSSYILDQQFPQFYKRSQVLFPDWWKEALVWNAGRLL